MHKRFALITIVLTFLVSCSSEPTITIRNQSPKPIHNVRLSGRGFAVKAPDLVSGEAWVTRVKPLGESGVGVSFEVDGKTFNIAEQGYFEAQGGYEVEILIQPDMSVQVDSKL